LPVDFFQFTVHGVSGPGSPVKIVTRLQAMANPGWWTMPYNFGRYHLVLY